MIRVSLRDDFSAGERAFMALSRDQLPYAVARTLTDVAKAAKAEVTQQIPVIFAKGGPPKPFTINSVVATSASKSSWQSSVFIKDTQAKYLQLEETGGTRTPTGAAIILPGSPAADLHDPHGNLPEGLTRKLRAAVRTAQRNQNRLRAQRARASRHSGASPSVGVQSRNARDTGIVYFSGAGPHGRGVGGYFERLAGNHLRRLTGFETATHYRPIFHYHDMILATVNKLFAPTLIKWLGSAMSTRK